ncbi:DUF3080 family protein [Pseudomonas lalucatii]|uniref:DUF3080 family protein n=1 Tax=Pseudomonas lalucatii TaxID=1424203 RepID=A0ABS5PW70_9PSED|nr:DUF3080 family protein [Pseudomonas lalucatii]MBS7660752.1 DUF3080 family protein [Pseudomonas lalucatii]QVM87532.1 DUF3080 family protein [Pseudomonas lalucatii]
MKCRILVLLGLLGLAACGPADDGLDLQADYLQRLDNAVEGDGFADFAPDQLLRYRMPPRRERLIEIPEIRIGLLDLLIDVRRCPALQQQISLRNSSLGKQLQPSSRLGYEGDLLRALHACLDSLETGRNPHLQATLSALAQEKRRQLPAVFWNAVNGSAEVERYLRFADRALPVQPAEDAAALDALAQLAALGTALPQRLPPPVARLDPLFFALHGSDQGGQLITSLASLRHTLEQASLLLERRLQHRPLCPQGKPTRDGRILQNIFVKFYAGGLQPYLAMVHQRGQRWSDSLRRLGEAPQIPPGTRDYLLDLAGERDSLWQGFQRANQRHVRAWQQTLRSCGLAPGQTGWDGQAASSDQ